MVQTAIVGTPYLIECELRIEQGRRERYSSSYYREWEPDGIYTGTFTATIGNWAPGRSIFDTPVVFEWPPERVFIAMQIEHVETHTRFTGIFESRVKGRVLGVASYEDAANKIEARQFLPYPDPAQKSLRAPCDIGPP